jgi:hypothetical protein
MEDLRGTGRWECSRGKKLFQLKSKKAKSTPREWRVLIISAYP